MDTKEKRRARSNRPRQKTQQDVVYTQPKPFNRNRFLLHMVTVVAVVLALLFGMTIFFNVENVTVSGTVKYDEWTVYQASGIIEGENLLTLSKGRIAGNILTELPYVDTVRVSISLPDTVHIQITELEVVYAAQDTDGSWWLISSEGRIVDRCAAANAEDHTRILGVQLADPEIGQTAVAYEEPAATDEGGETIPVTVYGRERLETAITITQLMEKFGFIGSMDTVDVSKLVDIQLWYQGRFQMLLGDSAELSKKVEALSQTVAQLENYDTGILDASFTLWPDQVGYSQFS